MKFKNLSGYDFMLLLKEYIDKGTVIGVARDIIKNRDGTYDKSKEDEYVNQSPISDIKDDLSSFISEWVNTIKDIDRIKTVKSSSSPYMGFSNYVTITLSKPEDKKLLDYYIQHKGQYTNCHFKFTDHVIRKTPYKDEIGMMIRDQVDYSNLSFIEAAEEMYDKINNYVNKVKNKEQNYLSSISNK